MFGFFVYCFLFFVFLKASANFTIKSATASGFANINVPKPKASANFTIKNATVSGFANINVPEPKASANFTIKNATVSVPGCNVCRVPPAFRKAPARGVGSKVRHHRQTGQQ